MDLRIQLRKNGYIHRHDLTDAGWSAERIRAGVAAAGLVVYRRQWLVHPGAIPAVHLAARAGGHISCVTRGSLLGAWRPGHDQTPHVALPPHAGDGAPGAIVHRAVPVAPRNPRRLEDPIENCLALAATCLPKEDALAVWESALKKNLITPAQLAAVRWRTPRARELCRTAGLISDSGLESMVAYRLRNAGIPVQQQAVIAGRPVDGLIGARLVYQIDGWEFHDKVDQRRKDIAHDRLLRLLGYTVLRYDYHEIVNEWPRVEAEIRAAMAQGLHLAR